MTATSWLDLPADHPFGIHHLPYGVFSTADDPHRRVGVRIGDLVLDLSRAAASAGYAAGSAWSAPSSTRSLDRDRARGQPVGPG